MAPLPLSPPVLPELPWLMVDMYLAIVLHQAMEEITQGVGRNRKHMDYWLQNIYILAEPYLILVFLPWFFSAQGEHLHP